jgi:adenylate kinase
MRQISTGDLFRSAIKNHSELGIQAKSYIDKGLLVPDKLVTGMVDNALREHFSDRSYSSLILDGYPRTLEQANALNEFFGVLGMRIDRAVFIVLPSEVIVKRLVGRRVCKSCGGVFHLETEPPKVNGKCDKCLGELVQRTDDLEEVIRSRLDIYYRSADALSKFYKDKGLYCEIDGLGSSDEVFFRLSSCLSL